MGLDSVELVISLEEAFGIELKDEEVTDTDTPRKLCDLIFSKLKVANESICQSQRAFYILRNTFLNIFKLDRKAVTPDLHFRNLILKTQEKEIWEQIKLAVSARSWPQLSRPRWILCFFAIMELSIFFATIFELNYFSRHLESIPLGIILGCFLSYQFIVVAENRTKSFMLYIPSNFKSVRDLIPYVITSEHINWTRGQVSERLKQIVISQLGLDESEYTEDSNFVKDFYLD
jgi:acyl carrier protein